MRVALLTITACLLARAQSGTRETLNYSINWPTGLSLGEGFITSVRGGHQWSLELKLEATVPGFPIRDEYRSTATEDYCSVTFEKESTHGSRKTAEKSTFDAQARTMTRQTSKGGRTEVTTAACAKDALAFLFHLRSELAAGRIPPAQTLYFGAAYQLKLQYGGTQAITVGESRKETDKITATLKGPASETVFDLFFTRDAARTPVLIRSPFAMGTFSMELVP